MNVELGILKDGGVILVSDEGFPDLVRRIEYYRDQRLIMLVYKNDDEGQLMHYEVPQDMQAPIEKSPNVLVYSLFKDHAPIGYKVPLIKVGEIY
jgi:hypothetical protein